MDPIKIIVHGVLGKMGQEVIKGLWREPDFELVGAVDKNAQPGVYAIPGDTTSIPLSDGLDDFISDAHVVVDFTSREGFMTAIGVAANHKVNVVTGSTGLTEDNLLEAHRIAQEHQIGIIVAPNFSIGAVVMIHLAEVAARFFEYADLTEAHHEFKRDSPSGTALAIAKAAVKGKAGTFTSAKVDTEVLPGTLGGIHDGVSIHSSRMPGHVSHHELVFGTLGQTLSIRHDSINRESFIPGVMVAAREVVKSPGLTVGLENIIGLSERP